MIVLTSVTPIGKRTVSLRRILVGIPAGDILCVSKGRNVDWCLSIVYRATFKNPRAGGVGKQSNSTGDERNKTTCEQGDKGYRFTVS